MQVFKNSIYAFLSFLTLMSFSQCSTTQKLEKKLPMNFGEVYFQTWVAGTREGGAGINLFIPITKSSNIQLDSVYFRGKRAKLKQGSDELAYVGRFKNRVKHNRDIIMSNEPGAEYGNKVPEVPEKIPFKLENDECVVSYVEEGKTKYFKISDIKSRKAKHMAGTPEPVRQ